MSKLAVIMFLDIVGAVTIRNSLGEAKYSAIRRKYQRLIRTVAGKIPGAKIAQWLGDGCLATFESVSGAIKTAVYVQYELSIAPDEYSGIAVRIGIDLGEISESRRRDTQKNGLSGLSVDRASRIMSLSIPGRQILVSGRAYDDGYQRVGDTLEMPDGQSCRLTWINHGRYKLKGFPNPAEIYEVGAPDFGALLQPPPCGLETAPLPTANAAAENDIFVSCASDVDATWLQMFTSGLKQSLNGRLKRDIRIASADQCGSNSQTAELEANAAVERSLILVVALSPGYCQSPRCLRDLAAFVGQLGETPFKQRIVIVESGQCAERNNWPAALQNLRTNRFWISGLKNPDSKAESSTDSLGVFYKRLDLLSTELTEKLSENASDAKRPDARPAVFLAEVPTNAAETRDDVKRYLAQMGFRVFPETWYDRTREKFRSAMLHDLERCRVFAQFLGAESITPGPDLPREFIDLQFEIAKSAKIQTFRWRSRELKPTDIKDKTYETILMGPDVRSQGLEDAKQEILRLADRSQVAQTDPYILFRADDTDEALAIEVLEKLEEIAKRHKMGCAVADLYGQDVTLLSENYGGLLVLYGNCRPPWVSSKLRESKAMLAHSLNAYGVCKGPPPPDKKPLLFSIPGMSVFSTDSERFDVDLDHFVKTAASVGRRE